jgi:hypothetical protein
LRIATRSEKLLRAMPRDRDPTLPPVEEPTDPSFIPSLEDPTEPIGFRDEPTAPAEPRTGKYQPPIPPWLAAVPDAPPRPARPTDPMFWPVVVFVTILLAGIGIMLLSQPSGRGNAAPATLSP